MNMIDTKRKIFRYEVDVQPFACVLVPGGADRAKVLHVDKSKTGRPNQISVWIEVGEGEADEGVEFQIFGTGHVFDERPGFDTVHCGTVVYDDMRLVWHVYRDIPITAPTKYSRQV